MKKALRIVFLIVFFFPGLVFYLISMILYGLSWLAGTLPAGWLYIRKPSKGAFRKIPKS